MTRSLLCALSLTACLVAAAGCGPGFTLTTPPAFVELDNDWDDYDYRATTADGLVIGVRAFEHDPKGDEAFWLKAIQNRMREGGGYALLASERIKSADGVAGTLLRFGHDREGSEPHLYSLGVFVTDATIYVLEVGGTKKLVEEHAADIKAALASFTTG
jgi:hypothetical protein